MQPVLVAIGGGSGSGKSTIAKWISAQLSQLKVQIISEDDYYHSNEDEKAHLEGFNFDEITRKDHVLLYQHVCALKAGGSIEKPMYDFTTHKRKVERTVVYPSELIIIEGTHILYNDNIIKEVDISVYIDVPDDIRLARRILRDIDERGRKTHDVISQYLGTVRPMHYRYTHPGRFNAHMVVLDERPEIAKGEVSSEEIELIGIPILTRIKKLLPKTHVRYSDL